MRRLAPLALLACAALVLPGVVRAQNLAPEQSAPTPVVTASVAAPAAGPTLDDATVGIHHTVAQTATTPTNATPTVRRGDQPTALMIVGGAAFLAGAIIGGDAGTIIMVGGAAVGLYGLYLYLQ